MGTCVCRWPQSFGLHSLTKPLYVDESTRFRGMRSVVVWHNRLKLAHRPAVLYAYHQAGHHCRAQPRRRSK